MSNELSFWTFMKNMKMIQVQKWCFSNILLLNLFCTSGPLDIVTIDMIFIS